MVYSETVGYPILSIFFQMLSGVELSMFNPHLLVHNETLRQ